MWCGLVAAPAKSNAYGWFSWMFSHLLPPVKECKSYDSVSGSTFVAFVKANQEEH
jgi:hypothetical protein